MSQPTKKPTFYEYECSNGPRPPVPGEESQGSKMTTEGASNSTSSSNSNSNRSPDSETAFAARVKKWQESFANLLADEEGVALLLKFVEEETGPNSINFIRLKFYFAVEGLKLQREEKIVRRLIRRISDEIIRDRFDISPDLRNTITEIVSRKRAANTNIFNELQSTVKGVIASTSYQTFLTSEFFIRYVEEQERQYETKPSVSGANTTSAVNNTVSSNDADGAVGFTGMTIELSPLLPLSNLQTLHEDSELNFSEQSTMPKRMTARPMPKLTPELLLATEQGRLEVKPPGPHGHLLMSSTVSLNTSFNPVSRQDSERQSLSSASLTDSDVNSKDGKPYIHRKPTPAEDIRRCMNPAIASHKTVVRSLAQGLKLPYGLTQRSEDDLKKASKPLDPNELCQKLNELQQKQDAAKQCTLNSRQLSDKLTSVAQPRVFSQVDFDDDQAILDKHVSRVFSPGMSPGTSSPKHFHRHTHRPHDSSNFIPEFAAQAMRHSKSIPEHAAMVLHNSMKSKLNTKWPSQNFDSGVDMSIYSANPPYKMKETKSYEHLLDDTTRKSSRDDSRKTRKQLPQPLSQQSSHMPTFSSHTNSLSRTNEDENVTRIVCQYCDEKVPYGMKIPGKRITLKNFKDNLPKKGNYRYFFKTACDDPNNPIIQEELVNDSDLLPMFEGKVMATLKPNN